VVVDAGVFGLLGGDVGALVVLGLTCGGGLGDAVALRGRHDGGGVVLRGVAEEAEVLLEAFLVLALLGSYRLVS
jgi:hypothetical protein